MEGKLLLIPILFLGVAVAQTGQQQTFSFSDPALQQVQPLRNSQPLRRQPIVPLTQQQHQQEQHHPQQQHQQQQIHQQQFADVFSRALQHNQPPARPGVARVQNPQPQQPSNAHVVEQGNESYQFVNTRSQPQGQAVFLPEQTRTQSFVPQQVNVDIQRLPEHTQRVQFAQSQAVPVRTAAPIPVPASFQVPVDAVPAPIQQHDAQVFNRRPAPSSPNPPIPLPQRDAQVFLRQPAPAQPAFQDTFTQQRFPEQSQGEETTGQFQSESQQEAQQFQPSVQQDVQQVTRTRTSAGRARGAVRNPVVAQQVVRAPPTPIQVSEDGTPIVQSEESDQLFREQAENAKYTFSSAVDDRLTDNAQVRQETRDGLNLSGLYSYSDGFYRRTVHYEADQNGYRVTKEEVEPIGDGPQPNPMGSADVATQVAGADVRYTITAADIRDVNKVQRQHQVEQPQEFRGDFV